MGKLMTGGRLNRVELAGLTPDESRIKAHSLRIMADALTSLEARTKAIIMAETWDRAATDIGTAADSTPSLQPRQGIA